MVLPVRVLDSARALLELGSTPLVVSQVYGLSNAIDTSVLTIRTGGDLVCTVRLLHAETGVPRLGRLVSEEEESTARTGGTTAAGGDSRAEDGRSG